MKLPSLWWLPFGQAPEISVQDLRRWLDEGRPIQVADARTALEFNQGTIGDAQHAPLTQMPASLERLKFDPALPVIMLCLSGHRSIPGTRWLRARGYQAFSLEGGILAWKRAGFPLDAPHR